MRKHYILWKFKEGVTRDQVDQAFSHIQGMKDSIPGIISIRSGDNTAPRNRGYGYFMEVLFENAEAHAGFMTHPVHHEVASKYTIPITERVIGLDFDEP